jgi:hypothetical protein
MGEGHRQRETDMSTAADYADVASETMVDHEVPEPTGNTD